MCIPFLAQTGVKRKDIVIVWLLCFPSSTTGSSKSETRTVWVPVLVRQMLCLTDRLSWINTVELNSDLIIQIPAQLPHCPPAVNMQGDQRHSRHNCPLIRHCPFPINVFQEFCFSVTFENGQILLHCFSYSCQIWVKMVWEIIFPPLGWWVIM